MTSFQPKPKVTLSTNISSSHHSMTNIKSSPPHPKSTLWETATAQNGKRPDRKQKDATTPRFPLRKGEGCQKQHLFGPTPHTERQCEIKVNSDSKAYIEITFWVRGSFQEIVMNQSWSKNSSKRRNVEKCNSKNNTKSAKQTLIIYNLQCSVVTKKWSSNSQPLKLKQVKLMFGVPKTYPKRNATQHVLNVRE